MEDISSQLNTQVDNLIISFILFNFVILKNLETFFKKRKEKFFKKLNQKKTKISKNFPIFFLKKHPKFSGKKKHLRSEYILYMSPNLQCNIIFKLTHQFTFVVFILFLLLPFPFFSLPCIVCQIINGKCSIYLSNLNQC
jgi:hypothetical protein